MSATVVEPVVVAIADLRRDGGTQPRDHISQEVAKDYAEAMVDGAVMPPVTAFYDGTDYWLADGFHRVFAAEILEMTHIRVDVRQGDQRQAILYSVGANADHGYRRSNLDKRRAVLVLINDPEWAGWSDSKIASLCHVSRPLVADLRPPVTCSSASNVRTFIDRHGNPSHMKTGNIGKRKPDLPVIAGKQAERKPKPEIARNQVETTAAGAAQITGLSKRNVMELAKAGKIEGAVKDGGSWVMPVAPLVAMVKEAKAAAPSPEIEPQPEPAQPPVYDPAVGALLLDISDTIDRIAAWPSVEEALAAWAADTGRAPADENIAAAGNWMAEFAARWPVIAADRSARIKALLQGA